MMYYTISPQGTDQNGNQLYLTAQESTNSVAVALLLPNNDPSQLWTPIECISPSDQGFVLLNMETNTVISAPAHNSAVSLVPINTPTQAIWKLTDTRALQLQSASNPGMNLNVFGGCPCVSPTLVYAWQWGGGTSNEVWTASTCTLAE